MAGESEGWNEYKRLILSELERTSENIEEVVKSIQTINEKITRIESTTSTIDEDLEACDGQEKALEKRIGKVEISMATLRVKMTLIVTGAAILFSAVTNLAFHFFK